MEGVKSYSVKLFYKITKIGTGRTGLILFHSFCKMMRIVLKRVLKRLQQEIFRTEQFYLLPTDHIIFA